jgi:uncharacterized protein
VFKTEIVVPSAARCAADLAWLLQSPPLLTLAPNHFSAQVQIYSAAQSLLIDQWLAQLDPSALQAYVAQAMPSKAPMRLGRYAERLMEYFLRESGLYQLQVANLPLRSTVNHSAHDELSSHVAHTTIGEFDYLITDAQGKAWHWELAVKFYLCHASGATAQAQDFKGPAGKDTLALKLGKVFDKQLRHLPPAPFDQVVWQPAAYARGWLFYPHGATVTACEALNPQHLKGWWLRASEFLDATFDSIHIVHLPRLHWLAPYELNELTVLTKAPMLAHLQALWAASPLERADAGQMLACVVQRGDRWCELSRGFVLP